MVRVLQVLDGGVLLERVVPGDHVPDDDEGVRLIARALQALWRPVPAGCTLPTVAQECAVLTDLDLPYAPEARAALADLLATAPPAVLLHGDLHHGNLLRGPEGWVAVDPHGLVGDPGYDVGPLLLNPFDDEVADRAAHRLDLLAEELELDRDRLRRWGLVRAVLSAAWTLEDHGHVDERVLRVAAVLALGS